MDTTPARKAEIGRLIEHLDGDGPPLVITGCRGAGKSRLWQGVVAALRGSARACLSKRIEQGGRTCYDLTLVEDVEREGARLLRRWGAEFRVHKSKREKNAPALPYFEVEGTKLYLLLDGIDHIIAGRALDASFLPVAVPRGMRLLVAVSHGPIAEAFAARGWQIHEVEPLGADERRQVVEAHIPAGERRPEVMAALLAWPHGGHPTHLAVAAALAASDGRGPGADEDVPAVMARYLDRRAPRPADAGLLALCEHGVPQLPLLPLMRAVGLRVLAPAVVERRGFVEPATPELRQALRARLDDDQIRQAHLAAFEAYSTQETLPLYEAAARHLLAAGDRERLAGYITQLEPFQHLLNIDSAFLERCWRASTLRDDPASCDRMLEALLPGLGEETRVAVINNVGVLADSMGWSDISLRLKRRALAEARRAFPVTHAKIGTALCNLAIELQGNRDNDPEVESLFQELLGILDGSAPVAERFPDRWYVLRRYAEFLESRDRYDEALARREQSVAAARQLAGECHPYTALELLLRSAAIRWRLPGRALADAEQAYDILRMALGPASDRTVWALRLIAAAQRELGQSERALSTNRRALAAGLTLASTHPYEAGHAFAQMAEIAEAQDDRGTAIAYRQQHHEHYLQALGPDDPTTLQAGWNLALRLEADAQFEKALGLYEMLADGYRAAKGPEHADVIDAQVVAARACWRLGRRAEAERRLAEWARPIAACPTASVRSMALLLRSEWAREDGHATEQRALLEQALAAHQEKAPAGSRAGFFHVMLAGNLFLAGQGEASARHHEAGVVLLDDWQLHLASLALRCYEECGPLDAETRREGERRRAELEVMLRLSGNRAGLDRVHLAARPLRAAWNPADGRTLAVLDRTGRTHLFVWHPEGSQLERLEEPLPQVELPKQLAGFTLRWSSSGQALQLRLPDREETRGAPARHDTWTPASPVSPDGRYALFFSKSAFFVMHARGPGGGRLPIRDPRPVGPDCLLPVQEGPPAPGEGARLRGLGRG
ncbi:MAG: hypothetical protein JXP73_16010 [Deltaproteobacteria bacterium]|nr:hypothetical protein [Deltaproteobacteria bacterium]